MAGWLAGLVRVTVLLPKRRGVLGGRNHLWATGAAAVADATVEESDELALRNTVWAEL